VGARVAWSGTGLRLWTERPTAKALRRAILTVLRGPRYRQASQRIAAEMHEYGGFAALLDIVQRQSSPGNGSTACCPRSPHHRDARPINKHL
jgi:UDP:flavonoid glycosyltransferase YjiC (YdhE family)